MNTIMPKTVDLLLRISGGTPFLTYSQLAEVFQRSPGGLKNLIGQDNEFSRKLKPARKKYGRRVYFSVLEVAKLLDERDEA